MKQINILEAAAAAQIQPRRAALSLFARGFARVDNPLVITDAPVAYSD